MEPQPADKTEVAEPEPVVEESRDIAMEEQTESEIVTEELPEMSDAEKKDQ